MGDAMAEGWTLDAFSLEGRTAIVTGASRGIGRAVAIGLAAAGADVAVCARSRPEVDDAASAIAGAGRRTVGAVCDVTRSDDVDAFLERVDRELGPVDILVNNAGGPLFQAPILDVEQAGWERVFDVNLHSVFYVSQSCARRMVNEHGGTIINVASILPTRAWAAIAAYSAAKAALLNLTQSLADGLAGAGIRVNAICPGWVRTDLNARYLRDPRNAEVAIDAVPLGRWADPDELVGTVVWLASPASSYVTGAVVPIDGGLSFGQSRSWQATMQPESAR